MARKGFCGGENSFLGCLGSRGGATVQIMSCNGVASFSLIELGLDYSIKQNLRM